MMHQRKAIRTAAVAQLVAGVPLVAGRVFSSHVEDFQDTDLPAINVFTASEEVEDEDNRPRELWRDLTLLIVIEAASSQAYPAADALDDIAEQVEAAVNADPYFAGTCGLKGAKLASTDLTLRKESDPIIGVLTLTYTAQYSTAPDAPANLADYQRTGVTTQIEGAVAGNAVSDLFNQQP